MTAKNSMQRFFSHFEHGVEIAPRLLPITLNYRK